MQLKKRKDLKILIVDDEESIVNFLKASMEDEGFNVIETENPAEVEDIIESRKPDLMLLDFKMPGLDGLSLLERIREKKDLKDVPAIIISAYGSEFDEEKKNKMKELDVKDIIPKSASLYEAKERILKVITEKYKIK